MFGKKLFHLDEEMQSEVSKINKGWRVQDQVEIIDGEEERLGRMFSEILWRLKFTYGQTA